MSFNPKSQKCRKRGYEYHQICDKSLENDPSLGGCFSQGNTGKKWNMKKGTIFECGKNKYDSINQRSFSVLPEKERKKTLINIDNFRTVSGNWQEQCNTCAKMREKWKEGCMDPKAKIDSGHMHAMQKAAWISTGCRTRSQKLNGLYTELEETDKKIKKKKEAEYARQRQVNNNREKKQAASQKARNYWASLAKTNTKSILSKVRNARKEKQEQAEEENMMKDCVRGLPSSLKSPKLRTKRINKCMKKNQKKK
jgi:hypothetical protein